MPFMKKNIIAISICLIAFNLTSLGQTIDLPRESITTLLCKEWVTDYEISKGVKKETTFWGSMNFKFKNDSTFSTTTNGVKGTYTGTWSYDPKNKLIQLTGIKNKTWSIISLKENELIMTADMNPGLPQDKMKTVYKPK
jgi:hypothetical protein